jgi:hypothetical protein
LLLMLPTSAPQPLQVLLPACRLLLMLLVLQPLQAAHPHPPALHSEV